MVKLFISISDRRVAVSGFAVAILRLEAARSRAKGGLFWGEVGRVKQEEDDFRGTKGWVLAVRNLSCHCVPVFRRPFVGAEDRSAPFSPIALR